MQSFFNENTIEIDINNIIEIPDFINVYYISPLSNINIFKPC